MNMRQINEALQSLPGWSYNNGKIEKQYRFAGFADAISFMTACAFVCEKMDHHPEWLNVYNVVQTALVTHSNNQVTQKDIDLAHAMDDRAERFAVR